jgi:hypothetical protein
MSFFLHGVAMPQMKDLRRLLTLKGIALGALVVSALFVAACFWLLPSHPDAIIKSDGVAILVFVGSMLVGAPVALLVVAPVYFWLDRLGRANAWSAALLGIIPSLAIWPFDLEMAGISLAVGLSTAMLTHWGCRRWLGAKNSAEQTPLRGAV